MKGGGVKLDRATTVEGQIRYQPSNLQCPSVLSQSRTTHSQWHTYYQVILPWEKGVLSSAPSYVSKISVQFLNLCPIKILIKIGSTIFPYKKKLKK